MTEDEIRRASQIKRLLNLIDVERHSLSDINEQREILDRRAAWIMCDIEHAKRRLYELGWTG